jgi:predicted amidophosphoribosyltransferase
VTIDPDCCARCGNQFPPHQVCGNCVTEAERIRAAATVLRSRMKAKGKEPFWGLVFVRTLERHADRLEAAK